MEPNKRLDDQDQSRPAYRWWILIGAIALGAILLSVFSTNNAEQPEVVSLPEIVDIVEARQVEEITVQGDTIVLTTKGGETLSARKESNISAIEAMQLIGASPEILRDLPIVVEEEAGAGVFSFFSILLTLAPMLFIGFIIFMVARQMRGGGGVGNLPGQFGRSNARVLGGATDKTGAYKRPQVTFMDVAGAEQAKLELQEVVEFLKEPDKFLKLGARVPKGVLMAGAPGTGKTLMAKAIAGEAGVPFLSISGSEFVEMFVGVGASRVRDLFKKAKEQSPAVIFVDEIDAVGRQRGIGMGGGNDEREQTLNQILVEMDGFDTDTNIIIIAATNRPDVLDPALLRPGRFDRKVILDRPDVQAREAILRVHTRGKPIAPSVSLSDLAKLTPGFVGADLENLVNEAAILAARRNLNMVGQPEFQDAMERIVAGAERQTNLLSDKERRVVAFHEAGHAVVMHNVDEGDPVHKVSIVSRGMALGYTMPLPENEKYLRSKEAFESEIIGLLGGRAAEELIFNRITTGAANDLERATKLARSMVTRYGFSSKLGLRTFGEDQGNPYLGNIGEVRNYSEDMAQHIDKEISDILHHAYQSAKEILARQRDKLDSLAAALLEKETVDRPEFEALMA